MYKLIVATLLTIAIYLLFDFRIIKTAKYTSRQVIRKTKKMLRQKPKQTAKEFVIELEGRKKENTFKKALNTTKVALDKTGRSNKYKQTVKYAVITSTIGVFIGFLFSNPLLSLVLGIGLYFVPLWIVNLSIYSYDKAVASELETALSLITTSYNRHNSLTQAVEESLPHLFGTVKDSFSSFVYEIKYVDANTITALRKLKKMIDNPIFHKWIDNMILCQSDHTQKASLTPIVNEFSEQKARQTENETNMMAPLRETLTMSGMVVGSIPLLYLLNKDWFAVLTDTIQGKIVLATAAIVVLAGINKAIKLSSPVD